MQSCFVVIAIVSLAWLRLCQICACSTEVRRCEAVWIGFILVTLSGCLAFGSSEKQTRLNRLRAPPWSAAVCTSRLNKVVVNRSGSGASSLALKGNCSLGQLAIRVSCSDQYRDL